MPIFFDVGLLTERLKACERYKCFNVNESYDSWKQLDAFGTYEPSSRLGGHQTHFIIIAQISAKRVKTRYYFLVLFDLGLANSICTAQVTIDHIEIPYLFGFF